MGLVGASSENQMSIILHNSGNVLYNYLIFKTLTSDTNLSTLFF